MMANNMIYRDHIETPCSLGIVLGNTALGTVFLDTLPKMGLGVQNPYAWEISRSSRDVFPNTFLLSPRTETVH